MVHRIMCLVVVALCFVYIFVVTNFFSGKIYSPPLFTSSKAETILSREYAAAFQPFTHLFQKTKSDALRFHNF